MHTIEDLNSIAQQSIIYPEILQRELPLTLKARQTITQARQSIRQIIQGTDKRLLVIVGPCSIHDLDAAKEYAHLLQTAAKRFSDKLFIVMRVYFEKPRTTIGWRGLISDPFLDGSIDINYGLRQARSLLLEFAEQGLPAATEFLDTLVPHYLSDLISWCAIGARTSESQLHRELASSLAMPVGFKNSTDGNIQIAIDAVQVAALSHPFLSMNKQGIPTVIRTSGNPHCHIVLRGSHSTPNYSAENVMAAVNALKDANLTPRLMIDCSHGNSMKNYNLQSKCAYAIAEQLKQGSQDILGVMIESHLIAGKQTLQTKESLVYGQSITDGCIGWQETCELLDMLSYTFK